MLIHHHLLCRSHFGGLEDLYSAARADLMLFQSREISPAPWMWVRSREKKKKMNLT
jgi:hypothetical protein